MMEVQFRSGTVSEQLQQTITDGFREHSLKKEAPKFEKFSYHWTAEENEESLGVLTAYSQWDWLYVDELIVFDDQRGTGVGRRLITAAENYANEHGMTGLWLWTQSWQAEGFYQRLGYEEFVRFPNFPKGHERIGFRKFL